MKSKRTRLIDIAERLNVSAATVSRALQNRLEISEEMKIKVRAVAKEMHYKPNFMASHLRTQRNFSIGVVVPRIMHNYLASIISGILEEAYLHHYQAMICVTEHSYEQELKAIEQFSNGIVEGMLICVSNHTRDFSHIEQLKNDEIPFVLFDKDIAHLEAPKVVVDDYTGALNAVEHLINQGYKNIAHIQDNLVNHSSQKRMKGYFSALKKYGMAKNSDYVVQLENISIENAQKATENLLKIYPEIDAVFGITDEIAIGAIRAALKMGRQVPQDFGVVGFSNWQISEVMSPSLSTVAQNGKEMGRTATKLLIQRIEEPEKYSHTYPTKILKTKLIVRESSFRNAVPINTLTK